MYKKGQGYWTRVMTGIAAGVLIALGASWVWEIFSGIRFGDIPTIYVAAGAALVVLAVCGYFAYWFVATNPRSVDFLIAVESEMKKVNWSSRREILGSTWVVLVLTAFITLFVYVVDHAFFFVFVWMRVLDASA